MGEWERGFDEEILYRFKILFVSNIYVNNSNNDKIKKNKN